jgi:hypothetical protein
MTKGGSLAASGTNRISEHILSPKLARYGTRFAMIVAFDSHIWSWQEAGGISRYFVALGRALETLGHQVDVRAPPPCQRLAP